MFALFSSKCRVDEPDGIVGRDGVEIGGSHVAVFGESGRRLQNPGPLIRVPQGTEILASLHNTLAVPITVHGLGDPSNDAVVRIGPKEIKEVRFKATMPGLYFYWVQLKPTI